MSEMIAQLCKHENLSLNSQKQCKSWPHSRNISTGGREVETEKCSEARGVASLGYIVRKPTRRDHGSTRWKVRPAGSADLHME